MGRSWRARGGGGGRPGEVAATGVRARRQRRTRGGGGSGWSPCFGFRSSAARTRGAVRRLVCGINGGHAASRGAVQASASDRASKSGPLYNRNCGPGPCKERCPRIFLWLLTNNKVLTRDNLTKEEKIG
jgi:hypothetical protein